MKKVFGKFSYDTDNSEIVKKITSKEPGDPEGYEETLYVTPQGYYFIYTNGGSESKYPKEDIHRLSKAKADEWLENN